MDTDYLQKTENVEPESGYQRIRWNHPWESDTSPNDRLQEMKERCNEALQKRTGRDNLECTVDPEFQGITDEQQAIWESEKDRKKKEE